jgi:hypothetical protein
MSVLSNFTTLHITNKTPHFITITCDAEQDDKFSVKSNSSSVVTCSNTDNSGGYLQALFQYFQGVPSKRVIINLEGNTTIKVGIKSKADLLFEFLPKIEGSSEHIPGDFKIELSDQCGEIHVSMTKEQGIAYDDVGNVCIFGKSQPDSCDLLIKPSFEDSDKRPLVIDLFQPSICKLNLV